MMTAVELPFCAEPPEQKTGEDQDLRAGKPVDASVFSEIRRRAILEGCKWDPQVGDVSTLAPFPLVMKASVWKGLALQAEQLAAEASRAEEEILRRPELVSELGLPSALSRVLAGSAQITPNPGRVVRFDFHYTTDGWKITEANSDVPGGFSEGSCFTALMAERFPQFRMAGNPGELWGQVLATAAGSGVIALLSAPGYMEDHQVIAFLAAQLRERGCEAHMTKPEQIAWRDGFAHLETAWYRGPVAVIVKFYQAEWLSRLPEKCGWKYLFCGGKTRVASPPSAVLSESKRFPLVWDRLAVELPTWRALLPETRDPREVRWQRDDGWLVKTALCNTGDTVSVRAAMKPRDWWWTKLSVRLQPSQWVAQRRFESVLVQTPDGPRHACVGIYTVNGRAAGAYARLSPAPIIDFAAVDAALLVDDE
jgi:glutathionylspermidine synthase